MSDAASEVEVQEKRASAVELKTRGLTFAQIATQLKVSKSRAHQLYQEALREIPAPDVEDHRRIHLERIEYLWRQVCLGFAQGPSADFAFAGVKILERHAKLFGLDMPAQLNVKGEIKHDDPLASRVLDDPVVERGFLNLLELVTSRSGSPGSVRSPGNGERLPAPAAPPDPLQPPG